MSRRPARKGPQYRAAAAIACSLGVTAAAWGVAVTRTDGGGSGAAAAATADRIFAEVGVRTVQVALGGEVLAVRTAAGASVDRPANIKSASKSILGVLAGIAIAEGHIEGVEQPLAEVLPESVRDAAQERLQDIRIEHLLTMTAGLESTSFENYGRWVASPNWLRAAVRQPVMAPPGERFC